MGKDSVDNEIRKLRGDIHFVVTAASRYGRSLCAGRAARACVQALPKKFRCSDSAILQGRYL